MVAHYDAQVIVFFLLSLVFAPIYRLNIKVVALGCSLQPNIYVDRLVNVTFLSFAKLAFD